MKPVFKVHYLEQVVPALQKSRGYKNIHEVPSIEKVVINSGLDAGLDKGTIADIVRDISLLSGQKPVITNARKSIANFKLREGMPVGVKVTLRGNQMYHFLYRMISVALPSIRDFRGVQRRLDGNGNYTLGIEDHTIFPEISIDGGRRLVGLDITIVTTAKTDEEGAELLELMNMPFRKPEKAAEVEATA
ncbi:MAG TPA: 50S ribosomal protein L5 [Opitutales bacterium]|nr:50S ribosomal protein L5 [Opitutales bacterium]